MENFLLYLAQNNPKIFDFIMGSGLVPQETISSMAVNNYNRNPLPRGTYTDTLSEMAQFMPQSGSMFLRQRPETLDQMPSIGNSEGELNSRLNYLPRYMDTIPYHLRPPRPSTLDKNVHDPQLYLQRILDKKPLKRQM